jgi:hypothetical protein
MLTKQDLNLIRGVVKDEIETGLVPVRKDIKNLQSDMTVVKKDVKKLRIDLDKTINFFDKVNMSTRSEVNKTRRDLGLNEVEFAY